MDVWHFLLYGFAALLALRSLTSIMTSYRRQCERQWRRHHRHHGDAEHPAEAAAAPPGARNPPGRDGNGAAA